MALDQGFYFNYPTREFFYMGERAGWAVPCSNAGRGDGTTTSWRFVPDDEIYGHQSASTLGALIGFMKGHIERVYAKVYND